MFNKLKKLTIQDKFKIAEATNIYPLFNSKDIDIDDEWIKRVINTITEVELENILKDVKK